MPSQIVNYQCPACTAPLEFEEGSGRLACQYCGSSFTVSEIEALYAEKNESAEAAAVRAEQNAEEAAQVLEQQEEADWDTSELSDDWGADGAGMKAYVCPSCGAELICDAATAATSCPYCGNPTVIPGQFSGALKPDYVIPFRLDKAAAVAALKNYYKGKVFLPKEFASQNNIQQIKGVYVPFWLFDGEADADVVFQATRSTRGRTSKEEIITTLHYYVRRSGTVSFEKIPVDASKKMPDAHMDAIEPFDYADLKPFSMAYLPGFLADKYDVSAQESGVRADQRAENSAIAVMTGDTVGRYETCVPVRKQVRLKRGQVKYALLPVWMLSTKYKDKNYLFAMNGQTGKLVGNLPISWGKFFITFAAIALPVAAIASLFVL